MCRPAGAIGRVTVRRSNDVGVERLGALDCLVEVVDLEPECDAVPIGS